MEIEDRPYPPRAIMITKDKVFYSIGITKVLLPCRPETYEAYLNPVWQEHEVWEFPVPGLYANGETGWHDKIPADLDGFYDPEKEVYVLGVIPWTWVPEEIKQRALAEMGDQQ